MILVRAPFRLPLGGGGTDLPSYANQFGGYLLTAAINKYMFVSVNTPACIKHISVKYSKTETVQRVSEIKHDLVRETLGYLDFSGSLEISSMADASAGTGLGSSGAYVVGLLTGMNRLLGRNLDRERVAAEAAHIEMVRAGSPVGKQDQYASAIGGIFAMAIDPQGEVEIKPLRLGRELVTELQYRLVMFYTNITRSANDILAEQSIRLKAAEASSVAAMHQIKEIGLQIEKALRIGDVDTVGRLMHEHWEVKRSMSAKMSSSLIDDWYVLARKNGALGGKVMGAGGGGFMLFCCESTQRRHLIQTMEKAGLELLDFSFDFEGAKILVDF